MSILFVKGFVFVNFELLVVFCHELPNEEFFNVFRILICIVGKP